MTGWGNVPESQSARRVVGLLDAERSFRRFSVPTGVARVPRALTSGA